MSSLDAAILAFAALMAAWGFRRGFIAGALSLAGLAAGAAIGTRVGPLLLPQGSQSPYAPIFGLAGALLAGAILASGLEVVGIRLRRTTSYVPGARAIDGALGAFFSLLVALGVAWVLAAVAAQLPGDLHLRADVQRSQILRWLNGVLPPSGPILNALARLDPQPSIPNPSLTVAPPSAAIAAAPGVARDGASVVRVLGSACGLGIEGSGWVAAPGIVVTNAHVVAGEQDTVVEAAGVPPDLPARAVVFDVHDDVAVLRVPGLSAPSLILAESPPAGASAAILGYPRNGAYDVRAARVGATTTVVAQDAYGHGPVIRSVTPLRGLVRPGNSGGPVVDRAGRVLATVFAATTGGGAAGGYGVANAVVRRALTGAGGAVGTGTCAA